MLKEARFYKKKKKFHPHLRVSHTQNKFLLDKNTQVICLNTKEKLENTYKIIRHAFVFGGMDGVYNHSPKPCPGSSIF